MLLLTGIRHEVSKQLLLFLRRRTVQQITPCQPFVQARTCCSLLGKRARWIGHGQEGIDLLAAIAHLLGQQRNGAQTVRCAKRRVPGPLAPGRTRTWYTRPIIKRNYKLAYQHAALSTLTLPVFRGVPSPMLVTNTRCVCSSTSAAIG